MIGPQRYLQGRLLADRVGIVDYDDAGGPDVLRTVHLFRYFHGFPSIEQDDVAADVSLVHQAAQAAAVWQGVNQRSGHRPIIVVVCPVDGSSLDVRAVP